MHAMLAAVEFQLPDTRLSNEEVVRFAINWTPQKILDKTGIAERRIAAKGELSSDLAFHAAEKLFTNSVCVREEIDFILFCTQSPDYLLPTTACLLQNRLKLRTGIGALDFNLGCSGYIYGLGLAQGLIETGQATRVLLLTGETYSKFLSESDFGVRSIFGDAGSATLLKSVDSPEQLMGPYVYGTDGRGAENLILKRHSLRAAEDFSTSEEAVSSDDPATLYMNGPEIFSFAIEAVPKAVNELLQRAQLQRDDVDLYVFHQANEYILNRLQTKLAIPKERFVIAMRDYGNTVSATIPIALHAALAQGQLRPGMRVMLVGFGVGYSWGACLLRYQPD
ncbi:3-oxoacyl-ACP synthase III family protein [Schlesneria paludicola]|uniref:3-oxoacyl-ACP synthase III family protein n=1 Tax=Schlesneria paludicola TaxID=360056 RepID=UPI00029AC67E|nr:ketoacyl-ACP synthase III [Schlesneria paludicola]